MERVLWGSERYLGCPTVGPKAARGTIQRFRVRHSAPPPSFIIHVILEGTRGGEEGEEMGKEFKELRGGKYFRK